MQKWLTRFHAVAVASHLSMVVFISVSTGCGAVRGDAPGGIVSRQHSEASAETNTTGTDAHATMPGENRGATDKAPPAPRTDATQPSSEATTSTEAITDVPTLLRGYPMAGPFSSMRAWCKQRTTETGDKCSSMGHPWRSRAPIGKRGNIVASSTVLLESGKTNDAATPLICAILVQTKDGWWVAEDAESCDRLSPEGQPEEKTALSQLRFADELGTGVVLAERSRAYLKNVDIVIDGETMAGTTEVYGIERKYCGVIDNAPVCSAWLSTSENLTGVRIVHREGMIEVTGDDNGDAAQNAALLSKGSYYLFENAPLIPFVQNAGSASQLHSDSSEANLEKPLRVIAMQGPFDDISHYCSAPPTTEDVFAETPNDEFVPFSRCPWNVPEWRAHLNIGGDTVHPRLDRIQLFSRSDSLAGAKIGFCHTAIQTGGNWFVSSEYSHCLGVIGPGQTLSPTLLHLRSRQIGAQKLVEIFYELKKVSVSRLRQPVRRNIPDPWGGIQPKHPLDIVRTGWSSGPIAGNKIKTAPFFTDGGLYTKESKTVISTFRHLYLRICGVGASGIPLCTEDLLVGCGHRGLSQRPDQLWTLTEDGIVRHQVIEYCSDEESGLPDETGESDPSPLPLPFGFP